MTERHIERQTRQTNTLFNIVHSHTKVEVMTDC